MDEAGKPAVRILVSGLRFETSDTVVVFLGSYAGELWSEGCTWRMSRTDAAPGWRWAGPNTMCTVYE
jgi:hypothetical protein